MSDSVREASAGTHAVHPPAGASVVPQAPELPSDFDMNDTEDDLERWKVLAGPLGTCRSVLWDAFREADAAAQKHQGRHRWLTLAAAVAGTSAVLFAIVQLGYRPLRDLAGLEWPEMLAVAIALIALAVGLYSSLQINWLLERHKAERLRLAKFRFLVDPRHWRREGPAVSSEVEALLRADVERIRNLKERDLRAWSEVEDFPAPPAPANPEELDRDAIAVLLGYYRVKRAVFQKEFFRRRARRHKLLDKITRPVSLVLFLVSVLAVSIHFGIDILEGEPGLSRPSRFFIVLAAALPVLGWISRTLRTAFEFARNTSRYRAKRAALHHLTRILDNPDDPRTKLPSLWESETLLEYEHHEWCRLMIEAEWF
jgi:hypothetical protein